MDSLGSWIDPFGDCSCIVWEKLSGETGDMTLILGDKIILLAIETFCFIILFLLLHLESDLRPSDSRLFDAEVC